MSSGTSQEAKAAQQRLEKRSTRTGRTESHTAQQRQCGLCELAAPHQGVAPVWGSHPRSSFDAGAKDPIPAVHTPQRAALHVDSIAPGPCPSRRSCVVTSSAKLTTSSCGANPSVMSVSARCCLHREPLPSSQELSTQWSPPAFWDMPVAQILLLVAPPRAFCTLAKASRTEKSETLPKAGGGRPGGVGR